MPHHLAVMHTRHGAPDVLHLATRPTRPPGPRQVGLLVRAAGVNPADARRRRAPQPAVPTLFPAVPGVDVAGIVTSVGAEVDEFDIGDEVLGTALTGAYAEHTLARCHDLLHKPACLDWTTAAALPLAATTACRALRLVRAARGETLLVDGAAGGVGSLVVQIARERGVIVLGTASPPNHQYLRDLGCLPLPHGPDLPARVRALASHGVDAALDLAGRGGLATLVELAGGPARVLSLADPNPGALGVRTCTPAVHEAPAALASVLALVGAGRVQVPVSRVYPLAEAAQAHRDSESGHVRGKIVLAVSE